MRAEVSQAKRESDFYRSNLVSIQLIFLHLFHCNTHNKNANKVAKKSMYKRLKTSHPGETHILRSSVPMTGDEHYIHHAAGGGGADKPFQFLRSAKLQCQFMPRKCFQFPTHYTLAGI
jgi:hypothetical protein